MFDVIHVMDLHNVKLLEKLSLKGGTFPKITDMCKGWVTVLQSGNVNGSIFTKQFEKCQSGYFNARCIDSSPDKTDSVQNDSRKMHQKVKQS